MLLDLINTCGNAKYARLKADDGSVELPTLMCLKNYEEKMYWEIGDLDTRISMNFPSSSIDLKTITTIEEDLSFIANFLMDRTIETKIINDFLPKTIENMRKAVEIIPRKKAAILIQPTDSSEILLKILDIIVNNKIKHIGITNFIPMLTNPYRTIDFLSNLRTHLPFDVILYLLTPVPHTYMPILTYLGIDVFNNSFSSIAAAQDLYLTDFVGYPIDDIVEKLCFCEVCNKLTISGKSNLKETMNQDLLTKHNATILIKKMHEIRHALKMKDLRSYVELNIQSNTFSATCLRLMDKNWSEILINRTPTWLSTPIKNITTYSYNRPAIKEYQNRIRNRFQINDPKKIIVIFPCSAKKPYSESKSHQQFLRILDNLDNKKRGYIQELILTSPLGVIPRELENVYPAAHYDIPVTGDWSQEEIEIAVSQLKSVLQNQKASSNTIIAHVTNEYLELCEITEEQLGLNFIYTSKENRTTSNESLGSLKENLVNIFDKLQPINHSFDTDKLHKLADYQFGKGIGFLMFPDKYHIISKPYQNSLILRNKKHMGTIQQNTGQLTLTLETAMILAKKKQYYISFEGTELKGSTLFAVGVTDADPQIRPTDAIIILDENEQLTAIGQAIVSGKDMLKMTSGQVAKIKQKRKT